MSSADWGGGSRADTSAYKGIKVIVVLATGWTFHWLAFMPPVDTVVQTSP